MSFEVWPLGKIPKELQRPELFQIQENGYTFNNPFEVVDIFEKKVAAFAGSEYAIATDSCSHGLFLSLKYLGAQGQITIPKHTYVSVPMQIIHAGCEVKFENIDWEGKYQLKPYPVYDAAIQWRKDMYESGFHVLSFQIKKPIPIGRGGMILTNDYDAYRWFKKAIHDGRNMNMSYFNDNIQEIGWHFYMTPEDAARGILLMDAIRQNFDDRKGKDLCIDISTLPVFKRRVA